MLFGSGESSLALALNIYGIHTNEHMHIKNKKELHFQLGWKVGREKYQSCPSQNPFSEVMLAPRCKVYPYGRRPSVHPRRVEYVHHKDRDEKLNPKSQSSPPGANFTPGGQSLLLGVEKIGLEQIKISLA
jgi:hypothetical protein